MNQSTSPLTTPELDVWFELRTFDEKFEEMMKSIPERVEVRKLWGGYEGKRAALGEPILALRSALERAISRSSSSGLSFGELAFACVLMRYDEVDLARTSAFPGERPQRLQAQYCGEHNGGDRFYEHLDQVLTYGATPDLVCQLLLFCLQSGFLGKYGELSNPMRQEYLTKLRRRVAGPAQDRLQGDTRTQPKAIEGIRFPFEYYAVALLAVLVVGFGLQHYSRQYQLARTAAARCLDGDYVD